MKQVPKALVVILSFALCAALAPGLALAQASQRLRRVAVFVGSNAAPVGRQPLRFAHEDARRMAEVAQRLGRFAPADVRVLFDPSAADLGRALDAAAQTFKSAPGTETMFVLYYSGHSDGGAIYPNGERMALSDLRDRLANLGAHVRIGILDTCRGGTWTRAKGLTVGPPLDPADLITLGSEGTVLLSSSSGLENAHEADTVKGSFFTHHLVAGLQGAADRSGDGSVTLQEAFDYAKEWTIRDSARLAAAPQHPSFDVQLRGRQDVVLTQLASSTSMLELRQTSGPLEVIHLGSGVTVVEMSAGGQLLKLALPPGKYIVRKRDGGRTFAKEITIAPGQTTSLAEAQLEATGIALALKGGGPVDPPPPSTATTMARKHGEIRIAAGVSVGAIGGGSFATHRAPSSPGAPIERAFAMAASINYGITDRLQWAIPVPAFAYRFGTPGELEIVPRLGVTSVGFSSIEGVIGSLDGGAAVRAWSSPTRSFVAALSASSRFTLGTSATNPSEPPLRWTVTPTVGYTWTLQNIVSLHPGLGAEFTLGAGPNWDADARYWSNMVFGSVLEIGYRPQPLVQVHVTRRFSLDAYASWGINLKTGELRDRYLAGFTWSL